MAGYDTILPEIKTKLEGVSGIANVYDYPRYKSDWTDWKSLIVSGTTVHFWFITRIAAPVVLSTVQGQAFFDHTWHLIGFYQVDDANTSYKTFQGIADDVTDAFNALADIDIATNTKIVQPANLIDFTEVMMPPGGEGGVMCHRATIELITNEDKTC